MDVKFQQHQAGLDLPWIVVGLIAGFLAGVVVKGGGYGCIGDVIVGVKEQKIISWDTNR